MEEVGFLLTFLFWVGILILLIYLIFRRIAIKEKEKFEKRDN